MPHLLPWRSNPGIRSAGRRGITGEFYKEERQLGDIVLD